MTTHFHIGVPKGMISRFPAAAIAGTSRGTCALCGGETYYTAGGYAAEKRKWPTETVDLICFDCVPKVHQRAAAEGALIVETGAGRGEGHN